MPEFGGIEGEREEEQSEARLVLGPTTPRKSEAEMTSWERRLRNTSPYDLLESSRAIRDIRGYRGNRRIRIEDISPYDLIASRRAIEEIRRHNR